MALTVGPLVVPSVGIEGPLALNAPDAPSLPTPSCKSQHVLILSRQILVSGPPQESHPVLEHLSLLPQRLHPKAQFLWGGGAGGVSVTATSVRKHTSQVPWDSANVTIEVQK